MLGQSLRIKKKRRVPLRLVPNYYLTVSHCPLGALVRFPCGEGAQQFNASLSQPNVQKNSRALVRGMGGLKFKKNARNNKAHTLEKNWHSLLYFVLFHSPPTQ